MTKIAVGGLMRCCTETLRSHLNETNDKNPHGTVVHCNWCREAMRLGDDDVWQWEPGRAA